MEDLRSPESLIDAIVAAPDDDAPRMVYADWLQERGDPRGELIALQCRPALFESDVFERAWRLEHEHGARWLAPLRELVTDPGPLHFVRGFVERIQLDAADWIKNGERLCALTPLREIELRRVESLAEVLAAPATARVRSIEVRAQVLDNARVGKLDHVPPLPRLDSLALLELRLSGVAVHALGELRAAPRSLYLDRNPACSAGLHGVLGSPFAARLERLGLDYVTLGSDLSTFEQVAGTLRTLAADHCDLAGDALAQIVTRVPLEELSAAATRDIDDATLAALARCASLRVLRLRGCGLAITPHGLRDMLRALPQLATLDLRECGLRKTEYGRTLARFPDACGWS